MFKIINISTRTVHSVSYETSEEARNAVFALINSPEGMTPYGCPEDKITMILQDYGNRIIGSYSCDPMIPDREYLIAAEVV